MGAIRTTDFIFNGQKLSDLGFYVVEMSTGQTKHNFGRSRTIETAESIGTERNIKKINHNTISGTITIARVDKARSVIAITDSEADSLNYWLFSPNNYQELITLVNGKEHLIYYLIFTSCEFSHFNNGVGYYTLSYELDGDHAYGVTEVTEVIVSDDNGKTVYITLNDSVGDYYPDIEFHAEGDSFKIVNHTLDERVEFKNLTTTGYRNGRVYGENMMFMVSLEDSKLNMREKSNKHFLKLKRGRNRVSFIGRGTYKIYVQPRKALH